MVNSKYNSKHKKFNTRTGNNEPRVSLGSEGRVTSEAFKALTYLWKNKPKIKRGQVEVLL